MLLTKREKSVTIHKKLNMRFFISLFIGGYPMVQNNTSQLTDEELASRCKGGDMSAESFAELVKRYLPLIKNRADASCTERSFMDDLIQEGMLGFLNAVRRFDTDRCPVFAPFADRCVTNRILNAAASQSRIPTEDDDEGNIEASDSSDPESIFIGKELMGSIPEVLSASEYSVFRLYISGLSLKEISARLGITEKSADNAVQRARRKLRSYYYSDSKS